jgi:hypothetical protein
VVGIAPEISYHIATLGPGNRLVLHAGPLVEFWDPVESDGRTRVGAQGIASLGSLSGEVSPLSPRPSTPTS